MKSVIRMSWASIRKMVFSRIFILGIIGVMILQILDVLPAFLHSASWDEAGNIRFGSCVLNLIELHGYTLYHIVSLSACVWVASCGYCADVQAGIMNQLLVRSSKVKYTISSIISCMVTGFLCMTVAGVLMALIYSFFVPVVYPSKMIYESSVFPMLQEGQYYLYIAVKIMQHGLAGAFFSVITFTISAFVENKFVIVASPVVLFFVLMRMGYILLPVEFDIINVKHVYYMFMWTSEGRCLLHAGIYTLVVGCICGIVFYRRLRRKC